MLFQLAATAVDHHNFQGRHTSFSCSLGSTVRNIEYMGMSFVGLPRASNSVAILSRLRVEGRDPRYPFNVVWTGNSLWSYMKYSAIQAPKLSSGECQTLSGDLTELMLFLIGASEEHCSNAHRAAIMLGANPCYLLYIPIHVLALWIRSRRLP